MTLTANLTEANHETASPRQAGWRDVELRPAPCGSCKKLAYPSGVHVDGGRCKAPAILDAPETMACPKCNAAARVGAKGFHCGRCGHGGVILRPRCDEHGAMLHLPGAEVYACNHCPATADWIQGEWVIFQEA